MKNRMVKAAAIIFSFLMLFSVLSLGEQQPSVTMQVNKNVLYPGGQVWANISVTGDGKVYLYYDPDILEVVNISTNGGAGHIEGKISVLVAQSGYIDVLFKAIKIGNTTLHMHANVSSQTFDENESISIIPYPNHIMFEPSMIEANINTSFNVDVTINATQEWDSTNFNITYDPNILDFKNYSIIAALSNSSTVTVNKTSGIINCNLASDGKEIGKLHLITFTFYGKKEGASKLMISNASLFNETTPLDFDVINGSADIIAVKVYFVPDYREIYMATGKPNHFKESLLINAFTSINSILLSISFNPSLVNVIGIENGTAFNDVGYVIDNSAGEIQITAINFTGDGTIINITFSTLDGGITDIGISGEAYDETFTSISIYSGNGTAEILIDDIPPTTTLQHGMPYYNDGTNEYITSNTPLYINASDDDGNASGVKEIHYIIDGIEYVTTNSSTLIHLNGNDGLHTIEYYSIDNVGNEESHHIVTYYLDNTPPTTTLQHGMPYYNDGTNEYITSNTPLWFNVIDSSGATTYCRVFNGTWSNWMECGGEFSISENGEIYIEYYSIDNLGHNGTLKNNTFYVDNDPPGMLYTVNPSSPNGENGWYRCNVSIDLIANDDNESGLAELKYKINNGEWKEYNGSIALTKDGIYTIQFYAKDNVENNVSDSITIKIDRAPPSSQCNLEGTYLNGKYTTNVTFTISSYDSTSGVSAIHYKVDGSWLTTSSATAHGMVTSDGSHTIEYYAVDKAGNVESHHVISFTIKKNKPPVASFEYTPSQPYDTDEITFDASSSYDEDGSIVNYTWDFGDGNIGYGKVVYHKYSKNDEYNVTLTVKDDKGATSSITKKIAVANKPPIAEFIYTPKKPKAGEKVKFDASLSLDDDGNIVNYTWQFEDGSVAYGKIVYKTYNKEGNYSVTLIVKDDDGATATRVGYVIVKKEMSIWLPLTIILVLVIIAIALVAIWKKRTKS